MAGPDRHGRGRRGARRVQEAPHAVIRRIYAATVTPRVFQVWEVSGDREYRICRVYSGTVYNRCIISICQFYASITVPIHGRDPASGGRNRGSAYSRTHASRAARRLPSRDRHPIARTGLRSAARPVRRCDREVRGPVRPRGRGLWRSVPAVRPPAGAAAAARATGRPRANASTGRNRTTGARRARRGGVCGSTVGVAGFFAATSTWSERRRHTVKGRRLLRSGSP